MPIRSVPASFPAAPARPPLAPRPLFLLDGLGAALSAAALGGVLPAFAGAVGVPARVLYSLAGAAAGLAAYGLGCGWRTPARWRPWLRGLAGANLLYAGATAALLLAHGRTLTAWGGAYFGLELAVIALLACWELSAAARPTGLPE